MALTIFDIGSTIYNALTSFFSWIADTIRGFIDWLITQTQQLIIQPIYSGINQALTLLVQRIDRIIFVLQTVPLEIKFFDELIKEPKPKTLFKIVATPILAWAKGYFIKQMLTTFWGEKPEVKFPEVSMPTYPPKLPPYYLKYVDMACDIRSTYKAILVAGLKPIVNIESICEIIGVAPAKGVAEIEAVGEAVAVAPTFQTANIETTYQLIVTLAQQIVEIETIYETSISVSGEGGLSYELSTSTLAGQTASGEASVSSSEVSTSTLSGQSASAEGSVSYETSTS